MKPVLQCGQRLQKYANTHPLCVRIALLANHKEQTTFSEHELKLPGAGAGEIAATPGALQPGRRFVHAQLAAGHFPAIEVGDGLGRFPIVRHFHEGEPAGTAGFAVVDYGDAFHITEGFEQGSEFAFRHFEIQIADKNILHFYFSADLFPSPEDEPPFFFEARRA